MLYNAIYSNFAICIEAYFNDFVIRISCKSNKIIHSLCTIYGVYISAVTTHKAFKIDRCSHGLRSYDEKKISKGALGDRLVTLPANFR